MRVTRVFAAVGVSNAVAAWSTSRSLVSSANSDSRNCRNPLSRVHLVHGIADHGQAHPTRGVLVGVEPGGLAPARSWGCRSMELQNGVEL